MDPDGARCQAEERFPAKPHCVKFASPLRLARQQGEQPMEDRVRIRSEEILSDDWAILKKTILDYRRRDGQWRRRYARPMIAAMAR